MNMRLGKYVIMLIVSVLAGVNVSSSQERCTEIFVKFRVNSIHIDPEYSDNSQQISTLVSFLHQLQEDPLIQIERISFCGAASPEGSYQYNRYLAHERMLALEDLVRREVDLPNELITYDDNYIPWSYLAEQIAASNLPRKDSILEILDDEPKLVQYYDDRTIDNRVIRLKRLGRKSWNLLLREYFTPMRNACMVTITVKRLDELPLESTLKPFPVQLSPLATELVEMPAIVDTWVPRLTIKTNLLGWGLGITNGGIEADLCRHWSIEVPVYYSAWNYFTSTVKFRTLAFQPEARYWFSPNNDGLFLGAHLGLAWYNIAVDGQYRIQDHDGTSPAWGGGLSVGYRLPISKDKRWKVEFTLGAGVYDLYYDKFLNIDNGRLSSTHEDIYYGLDRAAISFSYSFGLKKKGGKR